MQIKTTSRTVLRRMLRNCDREIIAFGYPFRKQLDARRREIRRRLKERR